LRCGLEHLDLFLELIHPSIQKGILIGQCREGRLIQQRLKGSHCAGSSALLAEFIDEPQIEGCDADCHSDEQQECADENHGRKRWEKGSFSTAGEAAFADNGTARPPQSFTMRAISASFSWITSR
jgi:hypothetical protein